MTSAVLSIDSVNTKLAQDTPRGQTHITVTQTGFRILCPAAYGHRCKRSQCDLSKSQNHSHKQHRSDASSRYQNDCSGNIELQGHDADAGSVTLMKAPTPLNWVHQQTD